MIWLVWRRYRVLIAITVVVLAGLGVWMVLLGHASDAVEAGACRYGSCSTRSGVFSLSDQATAINLILLFVPCLLGIVFGAPLVAGELEHHTNRLAWTQGTSRTKWLIVKWCVIGLILLLLVAALTVATQWWTGHAGERQDLNLFLTGKGRIEPLYFPITGLAFSAYTLFAFRIGRRPRSGDPEDLVGHRRYGRHLHRRLVTDGRLRETLPGAAILRTDSLFRLWPGRWLRSQSDFGNLVGCGIRFPLRAWSTYSQDWSIG